MISTTPHFLLYSDATSPSDETPGGWSFVLRAADGGQCLEATDLEPGMTGSQLELLAVIRGLEALDQPSRVTLVTSSRYVGGGLRYGLEQWRRSGWQWERFGVMSPINNGEMWRRLNQALSYHVVECRVRRAGDVPEELSERFRIQAQGDSRKGPIDDDRGVEQADDRHWPRRRSAARRAAAAMGAAAASLGGMIWLRAC